MSKICLKRLSHFRTTPASWLHALRMALALVTQRLYWSKEPR